VFRGRVIAIAMALLIAAALPAAAARYAAMVVDADTGAVLHAVNPDGQNYPASLTKMMTLYLVFEALKERRLTLGQRLPVSSRAAGQSPTKLDLKAGGAVTVDHAIRGIIVKSANDAAVVVAEALGGTEARFAQDMTEKAHALGMADTTFRNASGLPHRGQLSTARDMVTLARALRRDFPQYYHYFAEPSFAFGGQVHDNHNHLLTRYDGVDGVKTGYIRASGFNIVISAERQGRRLIGVVFGGTSPGARDRLPVLGDHDSLRPNAVEQRQAVLLEVCGADRLGRHRSHHIQNKGLDINYGYLSPAARAPYWITLAPLSNGPGRGRVDSDNALSNASREVMRRKGIE